MARAMEKRFTVLLGPEHDSFLHLVGVSPSALIVHLTATLHEEFYVEDYDTKWLIAFIKKPIQSKLNDVEHQREVFNWKNLTIKIRTSPKDIDLDV